MTGDIERLVRDSLVRDRRDAFGAGFADRTIARWKHERSLGDAMAHQLKRLMPIAIAAALLLGFYNARSNASTSTVDRLLGLTTVTVDAAYDLGGSL
jgi:hypothetical protein